ncbi:hypothetical protein [Ruania albidiflava]|uniref:hypothetical protein n=1 Tax=Ruania albidiflava TaxID=366586 RepID=UPI0003B74AE5|nr:hypothetical protein [Ruania albidiflava]
MDNAGGAPRPPARTAARRGLLLAALRHWLNWCNGATATGLLLASAGGARTRPGPELLVLAEGYRWPFPTGGASTLGDVVISTHDLDRLREHHPRLLVHEERHSRQWMLLGPAFLPLYLLTMGWSWLRTGDRAARCWFERSAGLADGGYRDVPTRRFAVAGRELAGRLAALPPRRRR